MEELGIDSTLSASVQVNNLGQRDVPVSINFWVPIELKGEAVWTVTVLHFQVCGRLQLLNRRPWLLSPVLLLDP